MYRISYLIILFLGVFTLVISIGMILSLMVEIDEKSGDAGSFSAGLSLSIIFLGSFLAMLLGLGSGSIVYVYSDKLPSKVLYKLRWSVLLCVPALVLVLFVIIR